MSLQKKKLNVKIVQLPTMCSQLLLTIKVSNGLYNKKESPSVSSFIHFYHLNGKRMCTCLAFRLINMEVIFKLQNEGFSIWTVMFCRSVQSKTAVTVSMVALVWCLTMLFTFCMSAFFHLKPYSFIFRVSARLTHCV